MAKKVSKNNAENRKVARVHKINGQVVVPALYDGTKVGHGKYMCGMYEATKKFEKNVDNVPVPFHSLQFDLDA